MATQGTVGGADIARAPGKKIYGNATKRALRNVPGLKPGTDPKLEDKVSAVLTELQGKLLDVLFDEGHIRLIEKDQEAIRGMLAKYIDPRLIREDMAKREQQALLDGAFDRLRDEMKAEFRQAVPAPADAQAAAVTAQTNLAILKTLAKITERLDAMGQPAQQTATPPAQPPAAQQAAAPAVQVTVQAPQQAAQQTAQPAVDRVVLDPDVP